MVVTTEVVTSDVEEGKGIVWMTVNNKGSKKATVAGYIYSEVEDGSEVEKLVVGYEVNDVGTEVITWEVDEVTGLDVDNFVDEVR